jgi:prepilin-type processing-associated H-X9-DG protein
VKNPVKTFLVYDNTFCAYFAGDNPFEISYWHDKKRLGYGGVAFVDGHVTYSYVTRNQPDYQHGVNWTFIYSAP